MINYLRIAIVVVLLLVLWRLDHVTTERDAAVTAAKQSDAKAASLRVTMRLQRELITDFQAGEA